MTNRKLRVKFASGKRRKKIRRFFVKKIALSERSEFRNF